MTHYHLPSHQNFYVFFSGLALWQDGGPNCREDAYGQPRLRPEDAVPLHSWGSGHAVPLQVPLRELLVHQVSFVLHVSFQRPNGARTQLVS